MFNNLLGSTDTAALLGFIAFLILILMGSNAKNAGVLYSIFNVYQYFKSRKIEYLKKQLTSPLVEEEDKKDYLYRLSAVTLQKELNLNEKDLRKLRYLKRKIDCEFAARLYKNCGKLFEFDSEKNQLKPIKPIDPKKAKRLETIGAGLFFASGLFAYGFMLYMLYMVKVPLHNLTDILTWAGINYFLMFAIIFVGMKILKFFMKQSNALKLLELSERNLDVPLNQNQMRKTEEK
ncbi:hypothetical protein I7H67_03060 [Acinetobacter sp. ACIN00229]|uniref:hypothetical protein n=1 Tax=Acinetobacter sp. ACIN00229 TaxID=2792607 RepID=UPI0018E062B1|nr:hypothetical protein [Acinetobacter sp. ACIN00229]MBI0421786.1 hypothetical protein [Acinetobacter sp. ACIN00229]